MAAKKTTILTADDPQLLRLVVRNLELEDYNVLTANDGRQALEQIEAHTPDLVLLDVMMPRMDGFTVCQRVRLRCFRESKALLCDDIVWLRQYTL